MGCMKIKSPVFKHNGKIPPIYTCDGENYNPPLEICEVPSAAKSLVLIMDDPDVPSFVRPDQMYDHWILFNIPPHTSKIEEKASPPPGIEGCNTSGTYDYTGPCPPDRQHRYFFKLYALDTLLTLRPGSTKKEVEKAMAGHILEECHLIGLYERLRRS